MDYTNDEYGIRLLHGECLDRMSSLANNSVDMVLADIPYGEVNQKSAGLRKLDRGKADICEIDLEVMVSEYVRICKGSFYVFCGTQQISPLVSLFKSYGLTTRVCAWEKTNPSPMNGDKLWLSGLEFCVFARKPRATFNEHCKKGIWQCSVGRSKIHPTEKPVKLFERLVSASTKEGDTVLDNTFGSCTTGVACINLSRKFVGIELDEEFFNVGVKRVGSLIDEIKMEVKS